MAETQTITAEEPEFHVRPRFRRESSYSADEIQQRFSRALEDTACPCLGRVIEGHATLFVPKEDRHYWSPQLSLSFEGNETGTLIRGLFSPRPQVWTMFVAFYSIIGFAALIILVFGLSYWSLGKSAAILWWVPVLAALYLSLYLVAYFGQRLGRDQMKMIQKFVDNVLS
jgi:hypothetical protein